MSKPKTKPSRPTRQSLPANDFWRKRSIAEIADEQGINGPQDLDALFGEKSIFASAKEFERFQDHLRAIRHEGDR